MVAVTTPPPRQSIGQLVKALRARFTNRVCDTFCLEFGYKGAEDVDPLLLAVADRQGRIARELDTHAKRLADRATMGPGASITSRSTVIV
jgi:hypothetical protein